MEPIRVEYKYTLDEGTRASWEITMSVLRLWKFFPIIGGVALFANLVVSLKKGFDYDWRSAPIFVVLLVFLFSPLLLRWSARRAVRKLPWLGQVVTYLITDDEVKNSTPDADSRFAWRMIVKVRERPHGFLVFPTPRIAHWLPKHGFRDDGEIERFRELARSKVADFRG